MPVLLMDSWAVPRVFSLTPPGPAVPTGDLEDGRGLTRWQYAWRFGFPSSTFGDLGEVLQRDVWEYRNIPFPARVSFDSAGRVNDVQVPRLP